MENIGFSDEAKLEINVNKCGVFIIGNVEGYLALARFCTFLAERHAEIRKEPSDEDTNTVFGEGGYHLSMEVTAKAINESRYVFSVGPLKDLQPEDPEICVQDVIFHVSDRIGPGFWKGQVESGSTKDWVEHYSAFAREDSESD